MNSKGQVSLGLILMAVMGVLVGLAIYQGIVPQTVGQLTDTWPVTNQTYTFPGNGVNTTLLGGQASYNLIVTNATSGAIVPTNNYTTLNYVLSNGQLISQIEGLGSAYATRSVNISYIYEPYGYIVESGSRSMIPLIAIFLALSIAVIMLVPTFRSGILDIMGR